MTEIAALKFGDLLASPPEYGANATALPPDGVSPRYLRITDIDDAGRLLHDDVKSISVAVAKPYLLCQNDIVIARTGNTVGKSYLHDKRNGPLAFAGYLVRFRIDPDKAEPEFIFQFLHSPNYYAWVQRTLRTGAQPNINAAEYKRLNIPPFTPAEQRRIAEILGTVDEAIEQTEALVQKWQQMKAGLMHDLFTRGVTPDGQLRPTRAQAPQLYKQSPLGWIPKEWEVARLKDKAQEDKSHIKTGPFGSSLKGEHWVQQGHPVITIGALGEGELLPEGLLFVSPFTVSRLHDYQLAVGDVVFSRVADVGRSAVIEAEHAGWIMSSNLMRISLNPCLVEPRYLQSQFASDFRLKAQIRTSVNSGGRDVANGQILNKLLFVWPPHDEQILALTRMQALDSYRRTLVSRVAKLRAQKQGLMQDLLTGRVPVRGAGPAAAKV